MMGKFFELLGKNRGKGAVSHNNIYNYSTAYCIVTYCGICEMP